MLVNPFADFTIQVIVVFALCHVFARVFVDTLEGL
jgi:hypothetical protein